MDIANGFNTYFIEISNILLSNIDTHRHIKSIDDLINKLPKQNYVFNFTRGNEDEILDFKNSQ